MPLWIKHSKPYLSILLTVRRSIVKKKHLDDFGAYIRSMIHERQAIIQQIEQIDAALQLPHTSQRPISRLRPRGFRKSNKETLRSVIAKVIAKKPMDRHEILEAVQAKGYHFSTNDPLNSLSAALYSAKGVFRQEGKKFYLVPGCEAEIAPKRRGRKPKMPVTG